MDPDITLANIRRLTKLTHERDLEPSEADDLAELIEALDDWIARGGFLPRAWARQPTE